MLRSRKDEHRDQLDHDQYGGPVTVHEVEKCMRILSEDQVESRAECQRHDDGDRLTQ